MKVRKEEIAASASFMVVLAIASFGIWNVIIEGNTPQRANPILGAIGAFVMLTLAGRSYFSGSHGDARRNGRRERPFVFWMMTLSMAVLGGGLLLFAIVLAGR